MNKNIITKEKDLHKGHRMRLKEKFERVGLDGFADHEVLEYLLTFAIPQHDVNPLAHHLINHFGTLNAVFQADPKELMEVPGVGQHAASLLTLVPQLSHRFLNDPAASKRKSFLRVEDRKEFFVNKFVGATTEILYVAYLNNHLDLLGCEKICEGGMTQVNVNIRAITDGCAKYHANAIIMAHNHMSNPEPSTADITTTKYVYDALQPLNVRLIDHLIVCRNMVDSLSMRGQIRNI